MRTATRSVEKSRSTQPHRARHFLSDIEALPDGGWVVIWDVGGGINNVEQQRFDANGDPVGGETRVNTSASGANSNSRVTALADGGWVVTWAGPDSDQTGIFQQRYDSSGAAVGSQTGVNTTTASFQDTAGITALPDGGWVVVWRSGGNQDGNLSGVYMQRFDVHGDAAGTETLVNVTTAGNQSETSVTALDGVGWVVTWVSTDPVTFDEVVMQRVFAADIEGTDGDDVIDGRVFDEAIFGLDGDDTINGGNGDDTIEGGEGTDNMDGGDGIDTLSYRRLGTRCRCPSEHRHRERRRRRRRHVREFREPYRVRAERHACRQYRRERAQRRRRK